MRKFEYKPPRVHSGELRTPVKFYKYVPKDGPLPGEEKEQTLFKSWAKVDEVWLKDLELAKQNGTESDLTITMRDPQSDYRPNNKHYISIDDPYYRDNHYNVKHVQPDMQNKDFIKVIAGLAE